MSETTPDRAQAQLEHTEAGRRSALSLVVGFLIVITAVPIGQHGSEILRAPRNQNPMASLRFAISLRGVGETLRRQGVVAANRALQRNLHEYESALKRESRFSTTLLPPAQMLLVVLGMGNERAYVGGDGWLYFRPAVDSLTGLGFLARRHFEARLKAADPETATPQPDPVLTLVDFGEQLRRLGVSLLVVPTPSKASVHPEGLSPSTGAMGAALENPHRSLLRRRLEESGIHVFDPAPGLVAARVRTGEDQYLRTDTHWRPEAMEQVAEEIARIAGGILGPDRSRSVSYRRTVQTVENLGDIAHMLVLPEWQTLYARESVQISQVLERRGLRERLWSPEPSAHLLLLGDSFTNVYSLPGLGWGVSAGLAEQLSFYLEQPIDRMAINAGGAYAARQRLHRELIQGRNRLRGKRLVIYQFAARELYSGDWKHFELGEP